jgi:FkbM family methyltransferase
MIIEWNNRKWSWNPIDKNLLSVNDWTYDFNKALPYIENKRVAIQAGGAMGLWPYLLSQHFDKVYTFEASIENYIHLEKNLKDVKNIEYCNKALGEKNTMCLTKLHDDEINNAGCYYTKESEDGNIQQVKIDDVVQGPVDFIQLDIEGHELSALKGAKNTIEEHWPVIMVEDKQLPHSQEIGHEVGYLEKELTSMGYEVVARIHRDIIFKK